MVMAQFAAAFPMRILPTLGPAISESAGLSATAIGYFASVAMVGYMIMSIASTSLVQRFGPVRTMQAGLALGIVGAIATCMPIVATLVIASLLVGMGDGPTSAAANRALQRAVPADRQSFAFSLKMIGGPLGGMAAGLALPAAAALGDWRVGPVLAGLLVFVTIVALQALRPILDADRETETVTEVRVRHGVSGAVAVIRQALATVPLRELMIVGAVLSFMQGCWLTFLVTFAVVELDFALQSAGVLFAASQLSGVVGRLAFGAIGDRMGARTMLGMLSLASAAAWLSLAAFRADWPSGALFAIAGIGGAAIVGWAGLQHAEIARMVEPAQITPISAAAVMFGGFGFLLSGTVFALFVESTASYRAAFLVLASLSAGLWLLFQRRRPRSHGVNS